MSLLLLGATGADDSGVAPPPSASRIEWLPEAGLFDVAIAGLIGTWTATTGTNGTAAGAQRPTRQANGVQFDTGKWLDTSAVVSAFTAYLLVTYNGGNFELLGGTVARLVCNANTFFLFTDTSEMSTGTFILPQGAEILLRVRRTAAGITRVACTGVADTALATATTGLVSFIQVGAAATNYTPNTARIKDVLIYSVDTVAAGTDAAALTYYQSKHGVTIP